MPARVTLIRHAETTANAARIWQGNTDADISEQGHRQLDGLRRRMEDREFDLVIASDLGRTRATVEAAGFDYEPDPVWREINVGEWEGKHHSEIATADPHTWSAFLSGEDVALGGGERVSEVAERVGAAFADVVRRVGPDGHALVVTHGLVTTLVTRAAVGVGNPWAVRVPGNTSLTVIDANGDGNHQLRRFNDQTHAGAEPAPHDDDTVIVLIRHGETEANISGVWQGHGDTPLTASGVEQAKRLAVSPPRLDRIYTSPLGRAHETARHLADHNGLSVAADESLKEFGMGQWEGATLDQIVAMDPDRYRRIRHQGEDLPRGGTGETSAQVRDRMSDAIGRYVEQHHMERIGVVSHGGATRAFTAGLLGLDVPEERHRIRSMGNTATAHIGYGRRGAALLSWNLAPHLHAPGGE